MGSGQKPEARLSAACVIDFKPRFRRNGFEEYPRFFENGPILRPTPLGLATVLVSFPLVAACTPIQQLQNVAVAGGALANSVTGSGEQAALSAAELRQLQSRDLRTTKAAAFASVMTVLLDSGYRVLSADLASGLVTATASSTGRLRLDPTGLSRASQTPMASVFVEEREADTARVRIVFSVSTSATGQLGGSGERAILNQSIYETFFSQLEEDLERRPAHRKPVQEASPARTPDNGADPSEIPAAELEETAGEDREMDQPQAAGSTPGN
jgi:hypothetical protein